MTQLSPKLDWSLANPRWASVLNPIIANPILQMIPPKTFIAGQLYTNGIPNFTSSVTGFVLNRGVFIPYQTSDGTWWLKSQAYFTCSNQGAGPSAIILHCNGVIFKFTGMAYYACVSSLSTSNGSQPGASYCAANTNEIVIGWPTLQTAFVDSNFSFDAELNLKPTWAD